MNGGLHDAKLAFQKIGSGVESNGIFREKPRFAIETYVIAVVFHAETAYFLTADVGCSIQPVLKFGLEVDVLRAISGRIGVGNVRCDQLLTGRQHIHIFFERPGDRIDHAGLPLQAARQIGNEESKWVIESVKSLPSKSGRRDIVGARG